MRQRPPAIVFWNSSSDGRIDSTTRDAWFLQIGRTEVHSFSCSHFYSHVYQYNTRYKFIIKHCVYLNVIMFLNNTLYTFRHYLSRIFDELASFDVSRGYHRHYTPVNIRLSNAISTFTDHIEVPWHPLVQNIRAQYLSNFRVSRYERSTIV